MWPLGPHVSLVLRGYHLREGDGLSAYASPKRHRVKPCVVDIRAMLLSDLFLGGSTESLDPTSLAITSNLVYLINVPNAFKSLIYRYFNYKMYNVHFVERVNILPCVVLKTISYMVYIKLMYYVSIFLHCSRCLCLQPE